ncbi:MAG: hypothetical protein IH809_04945 [Proteobacteria bacterium]|nr:hypothetical protein [Pseudomonadota bacterium]
MKRGWRGQATGIALILGGLILLNACEWQSAGPNAEQIAMNNRGVAQMGHFDYAAAQQTFAALIEKYPGWTDARVNLAIAMLNRQQEGDEAAANLVGGHGRLNRKAISRQLSAISHPS